MAKTRPRNKGQDEDQAAAEARGKACGTTKKRKTAKKRFTVSVFAHWCKACGICMAFCPKKVFSPDAEGKSRVTNMEACVGCRFCELHCPDFAIAVQELKPGRKNGDAH